MALRIYDKTDKGREEIATRKYRVPPKLRTLLVMLDGRRALEPLLKDFAVLGLGEEQVDILLREDFIRLVGDVAATSVLAAPQSPPTFADIDAAPSIEQERIARFRAVYDFYNQTIKHTIGLRGIGLQLKVEKAASIDDLRALRLPYLQAVLKAKGRASAFKLRERLDALLGGAPEPDDFALPNNTADSAGTAAAPRAAMPITSSWPTTR